MPLNMTDATMTLDLSESFDQLVNDPAVVAADKFAALQLSTAVAIEQTLRLTDCAKFRALAETVGSSVVELLGAGDTPPRELFRAARHDFNTFTHLTNVAAYSVLLAREIGIHDAAELSKIAVGAMLHDIGKRFIPARTLTKTEPVDLRGTRAGRVPSATRLYGALRAGKPGARPVDDGLSTPRTCRWHRLPGRNLERRNSPLGAHPFDCGCI